MRFLKLQTHALNCAALCIELGPLHAEATHCFKPCNSTLVLPLAACVMPAADCFRLLHPAACCCLLLPAAAAADAPTEPTGPHSC